MFDGILQFVNKFTVKQKEKIFLIHHLALVLKAGISLPKALLILSKQAKSKYLKRVLENVEKQIQKGNTFEEALSKYKHIFSRSLISMVRIGELKGDLYAVLDGYYELLRKQDKIKSKVKSAMIYPIVVLVAMFGVAVFAVIFVFPRLVELVQEFQGELPLPTKISVAVSGFLTQYGILLLIILGSIMFASFVFSKTKLGRYVFHIFFLKVPIFGKIVQTYNLALFSRNFGSLLTSGIPMTDALTTTASTINNVYYQKSMLEAAEVVKKGEEISQIIEAKQYLYPDLVNQIIVVGEQSGTIDKMMLEIAEFYEEQLLETLDSLASIIEPIIILLLGAGVAFLALSILLPLYSLSVLV